MRLSLSPTRQYKRRIILTGGLAVEVIRSIVNFLEQYRAELQFSEALEKDLAVFKRQFAEYAKLVGKHKRHVQHHVAKIKAELKDDFKGSIRRVDKLFRYLEIITIDDGALIFREMNDILGFIDVLEHLKINPSLKMRTSFRLHSIVSHMASALHHFWQASKAQARGYVKLEERSWMSDYAEKRHLKEEAIEASKIAKDMAAKKKEFVRLVNAGASHETIHKKIEKIAELYELEYHDLHRIMHQSKVLLHRTERLLNRLEHDAKMFKDRKTERRVIAQDQKVQRMLLFIQRQTLREHLDISHEAQVLGVELERRAAALRKT